MNMGRLSEQMIRERAHALWEAEGRPADRAHDHWVQAERDCGENGSDHEPTAAIISQQQADGIDGGDLQGTASPSGKIRGAAARAKGKDSKSD
jgi:hypothetical protein